MTDLDAITAWVPEAVKQIDGDAQTIEQEWGDGTAYRLEDVGERLAADVPALVAEARAGRAMRQQLQQHIDDGIFAPAVAAAMRAIVAAYDDVMGGQPHLDGSAQAGTGYTPGMDETRRRALALEHAGEVVEGSGRAAEPRRLGQMLSVRAEPRLAEALRQVAERRGTTVSELLRDAAVEVAAAAGYCRSCFAPRS